MEYLIEVYDTWGRRVACFEDVPLLEASRANADEEDRIEGLLPATIDTIGPGYKLRVLLDGELFCAARVRAIAPTWGDTRKLILDKYVAFHELLEVEAVRDRNDGNTRVSRAYTNKAIDEIVKDAINAAPGHVHYTVDHSTFPGGAQREYQKFLARKTVENELEVGGIDSGQWVGATRIDASAAFAKDGDTIAGLVVDGMAWPDVRFMMIDTEETSRNSHAIKRHPEVADWTNVEYLISGYAVRANDAKLDLQSLIDTHGIDYIELNPHRDASGAFDDRVDAFGHYIALVYGGGLCFNAAMVEQDHSDVYLYEDGKYHVPEMRLKEYFSYASPNVDSVDSASGILVSFDVKGGVFEVLTAAAYAARGYAWDADTNGRIRFRGTVLPDSVVYFDPHTHSITLGSNDRELANTIYFEGNPETSTLAKTYYRSESIDAFGFEGQSLDYFSIALEEDADKLCEGLLDDLAYPVPAGAIDFLRGDNRMSVGDIVEIRGAKIRRYEPRIEHEWNDTFPDRIVARVRRITHRFQGREIVTRVELTSPLRSVQNPLSYIVASQLDARELFQFRLDDAAVGLDLGYHLD
jgi:hypothetical protein